jgi:hypothetical protein
VKVSISEPAAGAAFAEEGERRSGLDLVSYSDESEKGKDM